jgi:hypothetical protein
MRHPADLGVHPRVAMQILRHADFKVAMEVYIAISAAKARETLRPAGRSIS